MNISIINTLVNHPNREAAAKYIDFSYPDPIESARRDPILAERMVGEISNEWQNERRSAHRSIALRSIDRVHRVQLFFIDGKFQSEPTIEGVTEVAKTIIESEYRDMYPVASDRLIESFIPIALARFFNFSYEQYLSCYHKNSLGKISPFLDPPLLEAY
jgi:hypothetical protein